MPRGVAEPVRVAFQVSFGVLPLLGEEVRGIPEMDSRLAGNTRCENCCVDLLRAIETATKEKKGENDNKHV